MQLQEALSDLKEIRAQLDRASPIREFRSIAVGLSGIITIIGSTIQLIMGYSWQGTLTEYLCVWLAVAFCSLMVAIVEVIVRSHINSKPIPWKMHRKLATQIGPSFLVGAVLTAAILFSTRGGWMLPGMWALIYSLGLFACTQHLPRHSVWAAVYFLVGGTICLWHSYFGRGPDMTALSAWYMAILFGGGQFLLGTILYWRLERKNG